MGNPEHVVFVPSCSDSDCIGVGLQRFARRSEAITAWNTRILPGQRDHRAEEIERALRALLDVIGSRGIGEPIMNTKLSAVRACHVALALPSAPKVTP